MAQYLHIRCVVRTDRTNAHERIHSVGGVKPDVRHWKLTQDKAISYIQDGTYVFYIEKPGGHRLDVIVATSAYGALKRSLIESNRINSSFCPPVAQTEAQRPRLT